MIGSLMGRKGVQRLSDKVGGGSLKLLGTVTLTTPGTTNQPIPSGAKVVRGQAWGAGAGGEKYQGGATWAKGGPGGGYSEGFTAIPNGATEVVCTVGAGGAGIATNVGVTSNQFPGGNSTITVGAITVAHANGGPVPVGNFGVAALGTSDTSGLALLGSVAFEPLRLMGGWHRQTSGPNADLIGNPDIGGVVGAAGVGGTSVSGGGGGGAGPGGGNGGQGGTNTSNGQPGQAPGGGGGGASGNGGSPSSGKGADGQIVLTFWG